MCSVSNCGGLCWEVYWGLLGSVVGCVRKFWWFVLGSVLGCVRNYGGLCEEFWWAVLRSVVTVLRIVMGCVKKCIGPY